MPNVQQTRLNKGALIALLFIMLTIGACFLPIPWWAKAVIAVVLVGVFLFIRRGYIYFYRAAVTLQKENTPRVWNLMKKALAAHVDDERKILICSAFIQQGDAQFGVDTLEKLIPVCKEESRRAMATVTLSMGYWRLGDLDKAIEILQDLRATGYNDDNLEINLETYLLEKGDLKEAKKLIVQSRKNGAESNGLLDNRGWYYIQMGEWDKAADIFDELIDDRHAKFPEAYVHGAQVCIHKGRIDDAIDRLGWALSKRFTNTCAVTKEYVQTLIIGLENTATKKAFARAMDENVREVSLGREFPGFELALESDSSNDMPCKEDASIDEVSVGPNDEACTVSNTDILEDDEREPNTDLTDDDYEYDQSYGSDDADFSDEDDVLDTSVDDDDREPNTDLTEEDEKITE